MIRKPLFLIYLQTNDAFNLSSPVTYIFTYKHKINPNKNGMELLSNIKINHFQMKIHI